MRYFERLRRSLRPENGRCGRQAQYSILFDKGRQYFCSEHYGLQKFGCSDMTLADGETMGCDYETTV